ncbi:cytochrome c oxidase subunit VIIc [Teladorsagia circumcincta]|uniref:Cytochrome c oxidase subunit VIIc n=1 Tax=Teladorsagia circumcincta TaxID=45464 RepID=A0A2G9UF34_TELCI|nr:cytochrome c oxidase subunit VIIc [Teladorsagia circumcincta]
MNEASELPMDLSRWKVEFPGGNQFRMLTRAAIPFARAVRQCHQNAPVKFTGQTPTSFIHDGWANARTPFSVTNKWLFATKAIIILTVGFWAPFIVVEYQLRKANQ